MSFLADDRNWFLKDRKQSRISSKQRKQIALFPNKTTVVPRLLHVLNTVHVRNVLLAERLA